jgi:hypothetical protein
MAKGRGYQSHEVVTMRQSTMTIGVSQGVHPDTDNSISILWREGLQIPRSRRMKHVVVDIPVNCVWQRSKTVYP